MRTLRLLGLGFAALVGVSCSGSNTSKATSEQGGASAGGAVGVTGGALSSLPSTGGTAAASGGTVGLTGGAVSSHPSTGGTTTASGGTAGATGATTSSLVASGGTSTGGAGSGGVAASGGGPNTSCSNVPAVVRGGQYFTFPEKFNRYYTDCAWKASTTVYVSPNGGGNGTSRTSPMTPASALASAVPGQLILFMAGTYSGCFELDSDHSGTYDAPIVLAGESKSDGSPGAVINCCTSGRQTCINLEAADYVAVDGFELVGGYYGVRAVGAGYAANEHQKGVAVLNSIGHGQNRDPFFTGQSDWLVIERCTGYDPGSGDGHGIYLSNGSDWNIARFNETYGTVSSDFQINADPISTCADEGVDFSDPECDAVAGSSTTGGRGASDFMLIDSNFFHHSQAQGPNFTSVRNSTIKNNIFALPARHGASFWQETNNPKLGSSNNLVAHNLFVAQADDRQAIGVTNDSTGNQFKNNVVIAVSISGTTISANPGGQLLATDATTVQSNTFEDNAWISGYFGSDDSAPAYAPNSSELRETTFQPTWFEAFPFSVGHDAAAFASSASAPWLDLGNLLPDVPVDRLGAARKAPVDLGPFER